MASKRFRDAVGIDPDRVISAAVDAALGETHSNSKKKKHHPGRVLVASAAVAGAAWAGQKRMPRLAKVPLKMGMHKLGNKLGDMTHLDDLADSLRDRLSGHEDEPDEDYYEDEEEFDDDEPLDEVDDEEFDDEDDEGFDDEDDDGFDDEPEDGDGPRGEGDEIDDEEVDDEEPEDEEPEDEEPEDEEPEDEGEDVSEPDEEEPEPDEDEPEPDEEELEPDEEELEPGEDDEEIAARSLELGVRSQTARDIDPATRPPAPDEPRPRRRPNNKKSKAARA